MCFRWARIPADKKANFLNFSESDRAAQASKLNFRATFKSSSPFAAEQVFFYIIRF